MKKFFVGLVIFALWIGLMSAFGPSATFVQADPGTSVGNRTFTLTSSHALTSAAAYTTTPVVWDNVMNNLTCDFVSSNGVATGVFTIEYSLGSVTGTGYPYVFTQGSYTTIASKPATTMYTYSGTGKPFRVIRTTYTTVAGSPTNTYTINCAGVQ